MDADEQEREAELYSVRPDGTKVDDWIHEELLGKDDVEEGEYKHVVEDEFDLNGDLIHLYGTTEGILKGWETRRRGGGGAHEAAPIKAFRASSRMTPTTNWNETRFILPDGTRLTHRSDTHREAAEEAGTTLSDAMQAGVIRVSDAGAVETGGPITDAQADLILDSAQYAYDKGVVAVDVYKWNDRAPGQWDQKQFEAEHASADTVRKWINGHYDGTVPFPKDFDEPSVTAQLSYHSGLALWLYGTTPGAILGWETRKTGKAHDSGSGGGPSRAKLGKAASALADGLVETDTYYSTKFILPDGTRLSGSPKSPPKPTPGVWTPSHLEGTHSQAASDVGTTVYDALTDGVVRYSQGGGAEVASRITEAQANHIYDAALTQRGRDGTMNQPLSVDVVHSGGREITSKEFDIDRDTPDTIRRWVNGHFALSYDEMVALLLYGTTPGAILGWETRKHGKAPDSGSGGGPSPRGEQREAFLHGAKDAVHSLLNGEKVNISREDIRGFLEAAGDQDEDPDLTDVQVDGMLIFGGNGLGIKREDMPQVPKEHRGRFIKELEEAGIKLERKFVSPLDLAPTQREISARDVQDKIRKHEKNEDRDFPPLLVAEDGHVLDGHHHWGMMAALAADDRRVKVPIVRLKTSVKEALKIMRAYMVRNKIPPKTILRTRRIDNAYRAKLAYLLYGTTPGAILGWETRKHGKAADSGSGGGPSRRSSSPPVTKAKLFTSTDDVDLPALAQAGDPSGRRMSRRLLFNPRTEEVIVGGATGMEGRDQSHAEAHALAVGDTVDPPFRAAHHDQFAVHGHLQADTPTTGIPQRGPLSIEIDRVIGADQIAQMDALHDFLSWTTRHGATKDTKVWSLVPGMVHMGDKLGKIAPELFKKRRVPIAATYRDKLAFLLYGTDKSGNYGHGGRPGQVGGSAPSRGSTSGRGVKWEDDTPVDKTKGLWAEEGKKEDGGRLLVTNTGARPITQKLLDAVMKDHDLSDVASRILEDVPGDLTVTWKAETVFGNLPALKMQVHRADGLNIETKFIREPSGKLVVHHDKIEVPEGAQGQDLAKFLMDSSHQNQKRLGVDRVDLQANLDQGGYAWAKYGFKAVNPQKLAERLLFVLDNPDQKKIQEIVPPFTPQQRDTMRALIEKHKRDPKLPWYIANATAKDGTEHGKGMLNVSGWEASLDMKDAEAVGRLEHYVGTKVKGKKPRPRKP